MPLAGEIALKLREIADRLDSDTSAEMEQPILSFITHDKKDRFLNAARLLPRPLDKKISKWGGSSDIEISHDDPAILVYAKAPQSLTCRLITPAQPAVYDCEPLLSHGEEEMLTATS